MQLRRRTRNAGGTCSQPGCGRPACVVLLCCTSVNVVDALRLRPTVQPALPALRGGLPRIVMMCVADPMPGNETVVLPDDVLANLEAIVSAEAPAEAIAQRDMAMIANERAADERKKADSEALERTLQGSADDMETFKRNLWLSNLEGKAEVLAAKGDLAGAIATYEELLTAQPPTSSELSQAAAARRALQQLLLESLRRERDACGVDGCGDGQTSLLEQTRNAAQAMGEEARQRLATRALEDVNRLRASVVRLLEATEMQAVADAEEAAGTMAYQRLVEGENGWFAGWQRDEAKKRVADARLLRKSVESDLNRLELQLLQGDPSLAWIRELLNRTRGRPEPPTESVWLQEQIASGALPKDPELLRTLLEQARRDPDLVVRLVTQAKDSKGRDLYTRAVNDPSSFR